MVIQGQKKRAKESSRRIEDERTQEGQEGTVRAREKVRERQTGNGRRVRKKERRREREEGNGKKTKLKRGQKVES